MEIEVFEDQGGIYIRIEIPKGLREQVDYLGSFLGGVLLETLTYYIYQLSDNVL